MRKSCGPEWGWLAREQNIGPRRLWWPLVYWGAGSLRSKSIGHRKRGLFVGGNNQSGASLLRRVWSARDPTSCPEARDFVNEMPGIREKGRISHQFFR